MRRPLVSVSPVRGGATSVVTPAPVMGWNKRDPLAVMDPAFAIDLENWFPVPGGVMTRKGNESHATGIGAAVRTLMPWNGPTSSKLFAATETNIYDVTAAGAVGAAAVSSLSTGFWQHVNFGTAGGNFLWACNGTDTPRYYNGSAWASVTITDITAEDIIHVMAHKRRLFFVMKDSLKFGYLTTVAAIQGAGATFDLASLCTLGGYLMAAGSWSIDGGSGPDDLAVFVTSKGEVVIYQGTDPGDANAWSLVGHYRIGAPVARKCLLKLGPDLVVLTQDGLVSLSSMIGADRSSIAGVLSSAITDALTVATRTYGSNSGWELAFYPRGRWVLINVPTDTLIAQQYVLNPDVGAWCKFTGMNANCWGLLDDDLYWADASGTVWKADSSLRDDDGEIIATAKTAFNYFGAPGRMKRFTGVRPILTAEGTVRPLIGMDVDFADRPLTATATLSETSGYYWDEGEWDVATWGDTSVVSKALQSVTGFGYAGALKIKVSVRDMQILWTATEYLMEVGAVR